MIPKTVHFIWIGTWKPEYEYGIKSVINNTNLKPILHTNEAVCISGCQIMPLVNSHNDVKVSCVAHLCDILRLEILYEHGGIYSDLDVIWLRNPTEFLNKKVVIGFSNQGYKILCNAVLMSVKGHPALLSYRDWLLSIMPCKKYWRPANPFKVWSDNLDVTMVGRKEFFPAAYNRMDTLDFDKVRNSICVHLFCSMNDIESIYTRVFSSYF